MDRGRRVNWIEIKYLPHAFWTCQGVGVRFRIGQWRAALVMGVPNWTGDLIGRLVSFRSRRRNHLHVWAIMEVQKMDQYEAREIMNDIAMRAALWEWLMARRPDDLRGKIGPTAPPDDIVQKDLKRIMLPKRKGFFGGR